jgi:hypothetical protein
MSERALPDSDDYRPPGLTLGITFAVIVSVASFAAMLAAIFLLQG